jgi:hypothetical protein
MLLLLGCGPVATQSESRPEVRVTLQRAGPDHRLVPAVTNVGSKPLMNVSLALGAEKQRRSLRSQISAGETAEMDWMGLPITFQPGERIAVYADGYSAPFVVAPR